MNGPGRLLLLARGPGVLALIIGAAIAATAVHRGHGATVRAAPAPVLVRVSLSGQRIARDGASGLQAWARDVRVFAGSVSRRHAMLDVELQLRKDRKSVV